MKRGFILLLALFILSSSIVSAFSFFSENSAWDNFLTGNIAKEKSKDTAAQHESFTGWLFHAFAVKKVTTAKYEPITFPPCHEEFPLYKTGEITKCGQTINMKKNTYLTINDVIVSSSQNQDVKLSLGDYKQLGTTPYSIYLKKLHKEDQTAEFILTNDLSRIPHCNTRDQLNKLNSNAELNSRKKSDESDTSPTFINRVYAKPECGKRFALISTEPTRFLVRSVSPTDYASTDFQQKWIPLDSNMRIHTTLDGVTIYPIKLWSDNAAIFVFTKA